VQHKTTLVEATELFVMDGKAQGFTDSTVTTYTDQMRRLLRWCAAAELTHLHEFTHNHIKRYFAHEIDRGMSNHYVHGTARGVRAFCNFCARDGLVDVNPFDKVKMPRLEQKILPALTDDETRRILSVCDNDRDRAIVLFLLDSGVRANELCNLNIEDMDMDTGAVSVRQGKGRKDRTVHIGARTRKQVKRYLIERGSPRADHAPLFASQREGTRLTYSGLAQILRRTRQTANVPDATAHAFRRTFAITCLRNGMNIYVLARLMGHADIQVLRKYLPLVEQDLQDAHQKHGPVDRMK
jgi:site-specific recombinase XerD